MAFRITRLYDPSTGPGKRKMAQLRGVFARSFPGDEGHADIIEKLLLEGTRFEVALHLAENARNRIVGFSFTHLYRDLGAAYLDFIASDVHQRSGGYGGALYERVRELLIANGFRGLYMDVPPDEPHMVRDPKRLPANRRRLAFYERYGARPIAGTAYEDPPPFEQTYDPPFLVFDGLERGQPLGAAEARRVVRAIFHRRYHWKLTDPHIDMIARSFRDDPVKLRPPRYLEPGMPPTAPQRLLPISVVVSEEHPIHHIRERGYVERPARVDAILRALAPLPVERVQARPMGVGPVRAVHDPDFVSYLRSMCMTLGANETLYPYVFPIRRPDRKPRQKWLRAGYYCIDTFTPLTKNAYDAAMHAVRCAVTGADLLIEGKRLAYALCRPPGHHAGKRLFGGFCYFNNAAIAAHRLSEHGKVAFLDIDFHHGNGSQDIFYDRDDVLFVSIHGHPNDAYPYFSGFADEVGEGRGKSFTKNYPLAAGTGDAAYLQVLSRAVRAIRRFRPTWLVVSFGLDIMAGDPTGSFAISAKGMNAIGEELGSLRLPTLVVQEGGYSLRNLGRGPTAFFRGLAGRLARGEATLARVLRLGGRDSTLRAD